MPRSYRRHRRFLDRDTPSWETVGFRRYSIGAETEAVQARYLDIQTFDFVFDVANALVHLPDWL